MSDSTSSENLVPMRISISADDLPALPSELTKILTIANAPDVSSSAIEDAVARDQALALRVLRIANSSFYGCRRHIGSVRNAVALLGIRQIQNIAAALALAPAFDSKDGPQLWAHALAVALWSEELIRALKLPGLEHVFTAALMHDIGLVLLLSSAPGHARRCFEQARASGEALETVERRLLGTDHAEIGAVACRNWNLPPRIGQLIERHHAPRGDDPVDASVLALADRLATATGTCELDWIPESEVPIRLVRDLRMSDTDLEAVLERRHDIAIQALAFQ